MEHRKKRVITAAAIALLLLIALGTFVTMCQNKKAKKVPEIKTGVKDSKSDSAREKPTVKKRTFSSNDDIRRQYGRLEVVYLYNGKKYEGAVISIDDFYTMVTVNGTVKIPMQDVKIREIVR